jgi:hypothetical protein
MAGDNGQERTGPVRLSIEIPTQFANTKEV